MAGLAIGVSVTVTSLPSEEFTEGETPLDFNSLTFEVKDLTSLFRSVILVLRDSISFL